MNDIFILPLSNSNQLCLIDAHLADIVLKHNWNQHKRKGYICSWKINLHNKVTGKKYIDHKNGLRWDNRLCNLRKCNFSQNGANSSKKSGCLSKYKGVSWSKKSLWWESYICINYKKISLGHFDNEEDAARAYDKKAKELFGEFAKTNF